MTGVFITGHVRSGTSMIAGLFRTHGVFFGECTGPVRDNRKGRVENEWLKQTMHEGQWPDWPESWFRRLKEEGWDREVPWGAKLMPMWWPKMRATEPDVVVLCYRPAPQILESCGRVSWAGNRSMETIRGRWEMMEEAAEEAMGVVARVWAQDVVRGDYGTLRPAFDALGIDIDPGVCEDWIDTDLWHGAGGTKGGVR